MSKPRLWLAEWKYPGPLTPHCLVNFYPKMCRTGSILILSYWLISTDLYLSLHFYFRAQLRRRHRLPKKRISLSKRGTLEQLRGGWRMQTLRYKMAAWWSLPKTNCQHHAFYQLEPIEFSKQIIRCIKLFAQCEISAFNLSVAYPWKFHSELVAPK